MSVVAPAGFLANGLGCGIKPDGVPDLALVVAEGRVPAAAVFTRSLTASPSVLLSRDRIASGTAAGVILNSGCANAGTGEAGMRASRRMAESAGEALSVDEESVLVCSTGPIGSVLPVERISDAVPSLVRGLGRTEVHGRAAAEAIMTTDSVPKQAAIGGDGWSVGGMAKGAGMIRPDMATMLAVLTTDAVVGHDTLSQVLQASVDVTFNSLNIDGCQSTNDTVILLASGSSGVAPDASEFASAVEDACRSLALQMAADAEGASKVVVLEVRGALSDAEARRLGMVVADSALVRSSFYGADPNWGRVLGALGVAGVPVDVSSVEIAYEGTVICSGGVGVAVDEDALSERLTGDFTVGIAVGDGPGTATVVTTDLTPDYVVFNGERS
jgi:glutamate N-acetyltransferase/amino-acid N-acetyltransferase